MIEELKNQENLPYRLLCLSKNMTGTLFNLESDNKKEYIIGRHQDCDFVITRNEISNKHCSIHRHKDGTFSIKDLNSTNGVYVNWKKITSETTLSDSDVIALGNFEMLYVIRGSKNKPKNIVTTTTINLTQIGYCKPTIVEMSNFSPYQHKISKKTENIMKYGIIALLIFTIIILLIITEMMLF